MNFHQVIDVLIDFPNIAPFFLNGTLCFFEMVPFFSKLIPIYLFVN